MNLIETEDGVLLREYRSGSAAAFEHLHSRYRNTLYLHARSIARDDAIAEELVNETFLRLAQKGEAERLEAGSLGPFLHTILGRLAIDHLRSEKSRRRREAKASTPWLRAASPSQDQERVTEINRAMASLPPEQAEVVVLHIYSEMSFREIGDAVGIPPDTAASRYRYALKKLSELLGGPK